MAVHVDDLIVITKTIEEMNSLKSNCNPVSTPADINVKLTKDEEGTAVDPVMYQSIVGSLLYVVIATQPDIIQAVGVVSKFNSKPSQTHLSAAK